MLDCLTDFIGWRPVCAANDVTPDSGLYIDDMPLVSRRLFEMLSDDEFDTPEAVWDKVYGRAADQFSSDVRKNMRSAKNRRILLPGEFTGELIDPLENFVGGGDYSGVFVEVWGSPLMDFAVSYVNLYLDAGGTIDLYIFDAQDGRQLWTGQYTGVAGRNQFQVNERFALEDDDRKFFVCYDDTGTTSRKAKCKAGGGRYSSYKGGGISTGGTPTEANIDFSTAAADNGLIVNYSLECNLDNFICQNKMALAESLRYKVFLELLQETSMQWLKISPAWLISRDVLQEEIAKYGEAYAQELAGVLENIMPDDDHVCFECNEPVKVVTVLP